MADSESEREKSAKRWDYLNNSLKGHEDAMASLVTFAELFIRNRGQGRSWDRDQEIELYEALWAEANPFGFLTKAQCPACGSTVVGNIFLGIGEGRFRMRALCADPDCRRELTIGDRDDPRADSLRDRRWSESQVRDLVRCGHEGSRVLRCPIDGAPMRVARFEGDRGELVIAMQCFRCGNELER